MTETQRRIRAYKRALPHMKERVIAVALLLAMSVSMMSSATFAWLTLSRSPEVSGLATTIATNGNLEIALSDKDGMEPDKTAVGDGGQDVKLSNVTWGNLINLSDSSYGLEDITLRPATLNTGSLDESPLYAVTYGADGRMEDIATDFAFTSYKTSELGGKGQFVVPTGGAHSYGVRAVSSVKATTAGAESDLLALSNLVNKAQAKSVMDFQNLYGNRSYIEPITKLAGVYISYRISDKDEDCTAYIKPIYGMMQEFASLLDQVGETVLAIANLQHYLYCDKVNSDKDPSNDLTFTQFKLTDLHTGTATDTQTKSGQGYIVDNQRKITLSGNTVYNRLIADGFVDQNNDHTIMMLKMYVNMRQKFTPTYEAIKEFNTRVSSNGKVGWEELRDHINVMADIYTATIAGIQAQSVSSGNIGSLTGGGDKEAIVQAGLLVDMDQMLGTNLLVTDVTATVTVFGIPASVNANVSTVAQNNAPYQLIEAATLATDRASGGAQGVTWAATDTYGMAIDFWVRTNAPSSLLTLEGKMITRTIVVGQDENGKDITQTVVVGYEGANRIWEEGDPGLPVLGTSVTQGSGSCYIFYPETPEDQEQSLKLLQAMSVAFISEDGELLAQADMDTSNVFKDGGRVVVPMKLRARNVETGEYTEKMDFNGNIIYEKNEDGSFKLDENGNKIPEMEPVVESVYYITEMEQNEAQRITAVIYMDGSRLTNSEVLAANAIKGQLNIQFTTTENMVAMDENDLKADFYNILITAQTNYDQDNYYFNANNKPTVDLTLGVTGIVPKMIKANFVSVVSETQGAKQPTFSFTKGESGWTAHVTLDGAGKYQLRSLQVDGVDYPLTAEQIESMTFIVKGTSVDAVTCENWNSNSKTHQTADSYYAVPMTVELSGTVANSVQGVFVHNEGQNVAVNFGLNGTEWQGTANFTTSGTYTLTYMIIDGVYVPLAPEQYKTLELKLGLNAQIFVTAPVDSAYKVLESLYDAVAALPVSEAAAAATTLTEAQVTTINDIITNTDWADAEKTAMRNAISAETFANEDQKEQMLDAVNAVMEDHLEALYSEEDGGLALKTTAAGHELLYSGGDPLYMDVSCLITDDQGVIMSEFSDVDLFYGIGSSVLNRMTSMNMRWDGSRYTGELILTRPGLYNFQKLDVDGHTITRASAAPIIRAISPDPVEYIGKTANYVSYYENIAKKVTRTLEVSLANAASAIVGLELTYTDEGVAAKKYLATNDATMPDDVDGTDSGYAGVLKLESYENSNGDMVFYVNVPTDGTWQITGMMVSGVFYKEPGAKEGVYYDGIMEEGGTGWLNFTDKVVADNITTEFFTTVNFTMSATGTMPNAVENSGEFMTDHIVKDLTFTLTDYLGRALPEAKVGLKYEWDKDPIYDEFEVKSGTAYPNTLFGADSLASSNDGTTFAVMNSDGTSTLNFQMPGTYKAKFSMSFKTPNGTVKKYAVNADPANGVEAVSVLTDTVTVYDVPVSWTLPDLRVTDVTGAQYDSDGNLTGFATFSVDISNDGDDSWTELGGVKNYYSYDENYANVYIAATDTHTFTMPNVMLTLSYLGNADAASALVKNNANNSFNRTYVFDKDTSTDTETIGGQIDGSILTYRKYRQHAGVVEVSSITMEYGDISFEVALQKTLKINQQHKPLYLQYVVSEDSTKAPVTYISPDGKPHDINLADVEDWTHTVSTTVTLEETVKVAAAKIRTDYKWQSGGLFSTTKYYWYDYEQRTVTRGEGSSATTTEYTFNGWTISGSLKAAGSTITVNGAMTATASITEVVGEPVVTPTDTYDVVQHRHTNEVSGKTSKPSGGQEIASVATWDGIEQINDWQDMS